jgi:hypothetical protein
MDLAKSQSGTRPSGGKLHVTSPSSMIASRIAWIMMAAIALQKLLYCARKGRAIQHALRA